MLSNFFFRHYNILNRNLKKNALEKLKKTPSKLRETQNISFPYCPGLPKQPKEKDSCSKM